MRDNPKVPTTNKRSDWTFSIDWAATAKVAAACVLAVALFALLKRDAQEAKWSSTSGTIQGTRIVADHALQTKWGGQLTWKAEYSVAYSIASREYAIWAVYEYSVEGGLRYRGVPPQLEMEKAFVR